MSASKIKHEFRTVLHVNYKLTKTKVVKLLRDTDILLIEENGPTAVYIDNQIDIGMYIIRLLLNRNYIKRSNPQRLRDYGEFNIRIYEKNRSNLIEIDIFKNSLFSDLDWVQRNENKSLKINDLIAAIIYCNRLDRLKAFN